MMRNLVVGLATVALLAGCSATAPQDELAATTSSTPTPTATVSAEDHAWAALNAQATVDASKRDELIKTLWWMCDTLDVEDVLMDGSTAAYNGWIDTDEPNTFVWDVAVENLCPDRAEALAEVRRIAKEVGPVDTDGDGDSTQP